MIIIIDLLKLTILKSVLDYSLNFQKFIIELNRNWLLINIDLIIEYNSNKYHTSPQR